MLQRFCYAGLGRAQSQEFTAFACAVEGFDLGEDGLAYELILGRHHLCIQRALQALLRLNARPVIIIIAQLYLIPVPVQGYGHEKI